MLRRNMAISWTALKETLFTFYNFYLQSENEIFLISEKGSTAYNHSHKKRKDGLETRAVIVEISVMLKFTERPKTPGITLK